MLPSSGTIFTGKGPKTLDSGEYPTVYSLFHPGQTHRCIDYRNRQLTTVSNQI